jgi:hypothetical protein
MYLENGEITGFSFYYTGENVIPKFVLNLKIFRKFYKLKQFSIITYFFKSLIILTDTINKNNVAIKQYGEIILQKTCSGPWKA